MMRTSNHHEEDEEDEAEDVAAGTDTSSHREGKSAEPKPSNYRSKHSETEQRRRNKINERFQILRELVPPNDQKRDKASLLLEVIEYIQFLQEKLQVYEGSYQQVWNQDPTKLTPWRFNNGTVDNFGTHPQPVKNGSLDEDNVAKQARIIHGSLESELSGEFAYRGVDLLTGPTTPTVCFDVPFQSCGSVPSKSILPNENVVSQPHFSSMAVAQSSILGDQSRAYEGSSNSISSAYSQRILRNLTQELQTSGVDLSQANISVQLDVGKRETFGSVPIATTEGVADRSPTSQLKSHSLDVDASAKESVQAVKRFRSGDS
ncbi:transcription factor BIM2-like [Silene latifolia]|uniref:transcription factor BIM2-like n=1 Tax=Silene latifolia TaxID=37657 RepID=UPI003D77A094